MHLQQKLHASVWWALLASAYLVYMFRHFETTFSIHHPLEYAMQRRLGAFFRHPVDADAPRGSKICPFGQQVVFVLVALLCVRPMAARRRWASPGTIRAATLVATIGATGVALLMNLNAALYLAPVLVVEWTALGLSDSIQVRPRQSTFAR